MRQSHPEHLFQALARQTGVGRTFSGTRKLAGLDGDQVGSRKAEGSRRLVQQSLRKPKPGGFPGGGQIVDATASIESATGRRQELRQYIGGSLSNTFAGGWGADLVIHDLQFRAFLSQTQHRQQKVASARPIDPTGAQNQVIAAYRLDGLITRQFSLAINIDGIGSIGLNIGILLGARSEE